MFDIGLPNVAGGGGGVASLVCHADQTLNKSILFFVIPKTYNFFRKQTLSSLSATRFVQMCEISVPQDSSVHGGIPTGSSFGSGDAHLLSLPFSLEDDQESKSVCNGRSLNSC